MTKSKKTGSDIIKSVSSGSSRNKTWAVIIPCILALIFWLKFQSSYEVGVLNDDVQYIAGAKSLVSEGKYLNTIVQDIKPQVRFPPGYPILLASVVSVFPDSVIAIKLFSLVLWIFVIVLFRFAFPDLSAGELLVAGILLVTNPLNILLSSAAMSEMAYTLFSLLVFLSLARLDRSKAVVTGLLLVFTFLIRSQGVSLIIAVWVWFLIKENNRKKSILLISISVLGVAAYMARTLIAVKTFPELASHTYFSDLLEFFKTTAASGNFLLIYSDILWSQARNFTKTVFPIFLYSGGTSVVLDLAAAGLIALTGWSIGRTWKKHECRLPAYYVVAMFLLVIVWNQVEVRYYIPFLPFIYFILFKGLRGKNGGIAGKLFAVFFVIMISSGVVVSFLGLTKPVSGTTFFSRQPKLPKDTFSWIKQNVAENEIIASEYAAAGLITGRKIVEVSWKERPDFILKDIVNKNISYLLLKPDTYASTIYREPGVKYKKLSINLLMNCGLLEQVYINPSERTVVLKLKEIFDLKKYEQAWKAAQLSIREYMKGNIKESKEMLVYALQFENRLYTANLLLAKINMQENNFDGVLANIDKAISLWPSYPEGYLLKVQYLRLIGNEKDAKEIMRILETLPASSQ